MNMHKAPSKFREFRKHLALAAGRVQQFPGIRAPRDKVPFELYNRCVRRESANLYWPDGL